MILTAMMSVIAVSAANVMAAGSSSITPAVSKDIKYYNEGVELLLEKKFTKAENQSAAAM
jgi:hypothetical protein